MDNAALATARRLSIPVVVLAGVQAIAGLLLPHLYRDIPLLVSAMKGNDLVTLLVVTPLLLWSLVAARTGAMRPLLIWTGCLGYLVYNYLYYLYGIAFNSFFLVYAAVFVMALYAFIYAFAGLDKRQIGPYFSEKTPVRWIAAFLVFIGVLLGIVEMSQILGFLFTGNLPPAIAQFGDPDMPAMVFAADLTLVIPAFMLAAVWLWQRRHTGFLLTAIMLVKAVTYGLALMGMVVFQWTTVGAWDLLFPFYAFIAAGGLVFLLIFLKNIVE